MILLQTSAGCTTFLNSSSKGPQCFITSYPQTKKLDFNHIVFQYLQIPLLIVSDVECLIAIIHLDSISFESLVCCSVAAFREAVK